MIRLGLWSSPRITVYLPGLKIQLEMSGTHFESRYNLLRSLECPDPSALILVL